MAAPVTAMAGGRSGSGSGSRSGSGRRRRRWARTGAGGAAGGPEVGRINVTPLIDVVMCLIIFFLLVRDFAATERGKDVELPPAAAGDREAPLDRPIPIVVAAAGEILLEGQPVPAGALAGELARAVEAEPGRAVQIRGDAAAACGRFAAVFDACREAGVTRVQLAAAVGAPGAGR